MGYVVCFVAGGIAGIFCMCLMMLQPKDDDTDMHDDDCE